MFCILSWRIGAKWMPNGTAEITFMNDCGDEGRVGVFGDRYNEVPPKGL